MGLTISGIGSGLDIGSIVGSLVSAEFDPKTQAITTQQTTNSKKISAYGELSSTMDAMNTAMQALTKPDVFNAMSASSSNASAVSVSSSSGAGVGRYDISVSQLAQANKISSHEISSSSTDAGQSTSDVGTGSLTIANGATSFTVDITAGSSGTASLQDVADSINNSKDNKNVVASIVNSSTGSYLTFTSKDTGEANQITVSANADSATSALASFDTSATMTDPKDPLNTINTMTQLQAAQDAKLTIDGVDITSATNTVSSAINNVTLTLNKTTTDSSGVDAPAQVSVSTDTSKATSAIQKFVDAFNSYRDKSGALSVYSEKSGVAGPLNGDNTTRSAMSQTTQLLGSVMGGKNGVQTLTEIGISFDDEGTMLLDSSKLNAQLEKDPTAVQALFVGSNPTTDAAGKTTYGIDGMASKMDSLTSRYSGSGGAFSTRLNTLNSQNSALDKDMADLQVRMASYQTSQTNKFNAMDSAIARMQSQLSYVTALFS